MEKNINKTSFSCLHLNIVAVNYLWYINTYVYFKRKEYYYCFLLLYGDYNLYLVYWDFYRTPYDRYISANTLEVPLILCIVRPTDPP